MVKGQLFCLTAAIMFASATTCQAGLLVNGGFESPVLGTGAFQTIGVGGEPAGFGWTVSSGTVDVGHLPVQPFIDFPAFEGNQGLDLNGTNRGAIFQDFATVIGQIYRLTFSYADNPFEAGVSSADVKVTDVGSTIDLLSTSITHSTSTNGTAALGDGSANGLSFSSFFTATGATTRLSFASTSASNTPSGGILLDAVDVSEAAAVPEPSSVVLLGLGLMGIAARRRRRAA